MPDFSGGMENTAEATSGAYMSAKPEANNTMDNTRTQTPTVDKSAGSARAKAIMHSARMIACRLGRNLPIHPLSTPTTTAHAYPGAISSDAVSMSMPCRSAAM